MVQRTKEARREKKPEKSAGGWTGVMCALLKGALAAVLTALLTLAVCSLFISAGVIPEGAMDRTVLAACILGSLAGGLLAVRLVGRSTLLVGTGVGAVLFLVLLSVGWLLFETASLANGGLLILLACLCGGAMAGILGARSKKKRKR